LNWIVNYIQGIPLSDFAVTMNRFSLKVDM
jgi:hypothetical protein